jgi:hypothetical protein
MKNHTVLLCCISLFFSTNVFNQKSNIATPLWNAKLNSLQTIIENKGIEKDKNERKILYSYYGSNEKFFFTDKGLIIRLDTFVYKKNLASAYYKLIGNSKEAYENMKVKSYFIYAEWQNTSPQIVIEPSKPTAGYYTFRGNNERYHGFSKITYKNIYPNIDIEYTLPNDSAGVVYNIILHPGADISDVQLAYSGDVKRITNDHNGNILLSTPTHQIIDHAPKSFEKYSGKTIPSSFILNNNTVTFYLPNSTVNKDVVIDPWVSGININGNDYGFDVDYDLNQNLYVYTRADTANALYVSKFSTIGTLLWTHIITTQTMYEGNFMVDRNAGKIYIAEGFNANGATAYRIDLNGVADGFVSQQNGNFREMWGMLYDYTSNKILGFGGGTSSNLNGGLIDPNTGAVSVANFTGLSPTDQDIVSETVDNAGKIFVVFAHVDGYCDHYLDKLNDSLNGHVWQVLHGMYGFEECANHPPDYNCLGPGSNAFNALSVNDSYLYYYDGQGLAAFDKSNGARIASTSVEFSGIFYVPKAQGGIAVDNCNNIYIGGDSSNILTYTFNGISFSSPVNIPLGWPGTFIWDVKYDQNSNYLFVSGHNGVCVLYAAQSEACFEHVSNVALDNDILLYPNPAYSSVTVKWEQPYAEVHIKIINMLSQVVLEKDISKGESISIKSLATGTYTVEVIEGTKTIQQKLMVVKK